MYVNDIAQLTGVTADTVRYYTKTGMLKPRQNITNGYNEYGAPDVTRLKFIRASKGLGFTLADIKKFFSDADLGESPCPRVRSLIERHIKETEIRLAELTDLHSKMCQALTKWKDMPDGNPDGNSVCSLIESLGENRT